MLADRLAPGRDGAGLPTDASDPEVAAAATAALVAEARRVDRFGAPMLLLHDLPAEVAAWQHDWADGGDAGADPGPYWQQLSSDVRRLARQNFPDATAIEYAATCLLRALRVFMARAPEDIHRRRLLIWLSVLTSVVREEDDGR